MNGEKTNSRGEISDIGKITTIHMAADSRRRQGVMRVSERRQPRMVALNSGSSTGLHLPNARIKDVPRAATDLLHCEAHCEKRSTLIPLHPGATSWAARAQPRRTDR